MNWYDVIKDYYNKGYYNKQQVAIFVKGGKITYMEYENITGIPYRE